MKVLIFQHIECEHPGQLQKYLQEDRADWHTVRLNDHEPIPPIDSFDALWVMGGPMDVWETEKHPWLIAEKQHIRKWVRELQRPFLGICLGHQLLADALGGKCEPQTKGEIGILGIELTQEGRKDPLFAGMPANQKVLQWHSVNVTQPPEGTKVLASSERCAVQAMRIGEWAWSIQYHLEAQSDTIETWGKVPEYHLALEKASGVGALPKLQADTAAALSVLRTTSSLLYRNFRQEVSRARGV